MGSRQSRQELVSLGVGMPGMFGAISVHLNRLCRQASPALIPQILIRVAVDCRIANELRLEARGDMLKMR